MNRTLLLVIILLAILPFQSPAASGDERPNVLTLDGMGDAIIVDAGIASGYDTIQLINAPSSIVISQTYTNERIEIIDSPHTEIIGNDFIDYVIEEANFSVITVLRSENVSISGNHFSGVSMTEMSEIFRVINVVDSPNVRIMENVFDTFQGDGMVLDFDFQIVRARRSSDIHITSNEMATVSFTSTRNLDISVIYIEQYHYISFEENVISDFYFETEGSAEVTILNITNDVVYERLDYIIRENTVVSVTLHSAAQYAHFHGFHISSIDPASDNSVIEIAYNIFEGMQSQSEGEELPDVVMAKTIGIELVGPHELTVARITGNQLRNFEQFHTTSTYSVGILVETFNHTVIEYNSIDNIGEASVHSISVVDSYKTSFVLEDPAGIVHWQTNTPEYTGYEVSLNGTKLQDGEYLSTIGLDIDFGGRQLGYYEGVVHLSAGAEPVVIDQFNLTICDTTNPTITGTTNFEMTEGTEGNVLSYTISDYNLALITIYNNETELQLDYVLASVVNIDYNVDFLTVGYYVFRIEAIDIVGNKQYLLTNVNVLEGEKPGSIIPTVEFLNSSVFLEVSTSHTLSWSTVNGLYYQLWINSTLVDEGLITGFTYYNFSTVRIGLYNLTIKVTSISNDSSVLQSVITVVDLNAPLVTVQSSISMYNDETREVIWTVVDDGTLANYSITFDDQIVQEANDSSSWIDYILTNLEEGQYNLTLRIADEAGNLSEATVLVFVFNSIYRDLNQYTFSTSDTGSEDTGIAPDINIPPEVLYGVAIIGVGAIGVSLIRRRP